jgi:hypothetical protein
MKHVYIKHRDRADFEDDATGLYDGYHAKKPGDAAPRGQSDAKVYSSVADAQTSFYNVNLPSPHA